MTGKELNTIDSIFKQVFNELNKGDCKHGRQDDMCLEKFYMIIGEEFGELGQAMSAKVFSNGKHHDELDWRAECIQVMAMCLKCMIRAKE